jgi:hypothetical protein
MDSGYLQSLRYEATASKRGILKTIEITEEDLIKEIDS